jgi:hypothetical protein
MCIPFTSVKLRYMHWFTGKTIHILYVSRKSQLRALNTGRLHCALANNTHTHIRTYTHMHIHTCTYVRTHACTYIHAHTYVHTCTYIHAHTYVRTHTCTYIHTRTYVRTYTHAHTYMHIHTYVHTHAHAHLSTWVSAVLYFKRSPHIALNKQTLLFRFHQFWYETPCSCPSDTFDSLDCSNCIIWKRKVSCSRTRTLRKRESCGGQFVCALSACSRL